MGLFASEERFLRIMKYDKQVLLVLSAWSELLLAFHSHNGHLETYVVRTWSLKDFDIWSRKMCTFVNL
jgi:hypothetical protein